MQHNILWKGIEYHSLENCHISFGNKGFEAHSIILGAYQDIIYQVSYKIQTNLYWETVSFDVKAQLNKDLFELHCSSDGKGNWVADEKAIEAWEGCIDIDIPLTPFTNSLPINRLQLPAFQEKTIKVVYIDILERQVKVLQQKYTKLSKLNYHYENVPNDFEATITVDDSGLVRYYPQLFERTFIKND